MLAILWKTLYQKRIAILMWALGAMAMVWLVLVFYPSFSEGDALEDLAKTLPPSLQSLVGDPANLKTVGGYIDAQVMQLRIPMVTIVMAIIFGIGLSAGDEERGTLATVLAQPVSRTRVFLEKYAALVVSVGAVHLAVFASILATLAMISESYSASLIAQAVFGCFVLTMVFGTLAFSIGFLTGKRGLATAIASVAAFGGLLIDSLAPSVAALQDVEKWLPYYYYTNPSIALHGLDWVGIAFHMLWVSVALLLGWATFRHRDVEV